MDPEELTRHAQVDAPPTRSLIGFFQFGKEVFAPTVPGFDRAVLKPCNEIVGVRREGDGARKEDAAILDGDVTGHGVQTPADGFDFG